MRNIAEKSGATRIEGTIVNVALDEDEFNNIRSRLVSFWQLKPSSTKFGVLAPINDIQARQLRAWLINRFNR